MHRESSKTKNQKAKKRARKKKRDRFVINAVILAVAAVIVVITANLSGAGNVKDEKPQENAPIQSEAVKDGGTQAAVEGNVSTDAAVRFDFIDVGQGDSALITTPNKEYILVDAGTADSDKLLKHLEARSVDELDYLILSHPHSDHIGSAEDILEKYKVNCVIMSEAEATTRTFERLYDALMLEKQSSGCKVYSAKIKDKYNIDGCVIDIIGPVNCDEDNLNNCSVCFTFTYGEFDALFTGDTEATAEKELLSAGYVSDCELYKVAHHGSDTSSSERFIAEVNPEVSVISCGKDNSYGHPSTEILERLSAVGSEIYITAECGTVTVLSDGKEYSVSSER